jgi:hypothetical protein
MGVWLKEVAHRLANELQTLDQNFRTSNPNQIDQKLTIRRNTNNPKWSTTPAFTKLEMCRIYFEFKIHLPLINF